MAKTETDRIEKTLVLKAPQSRVWQAIADAEQFGEWFRIKFEGGFAEGEVSRGRILHPGYEHLVVEVWVERIEPESYFSYRWHPYAIDTKVDYSSEPTTLVEFRLAAVKDGTELRISESGFDRIPQTRRAEAFRMNDQGWSIQAKNIENHVTQK